MNFVCGGESRKCDPFAASVPVGGGNGGCELVGVADVCIDSELSFCPESRPGDMQLILSFWRRY